jgi:hypothetical protein
VTRGKWLLTSWYVDHECSSTQLFRQYVRFEQSNSE